MCTCPDTGCTSPGKHPVAKGWQDAATHDPDAILAAWQAMPWANVGIATGRASNLTIVDIDGDDGLETLLALERKHGPLVCPRVITGSGGYHLYFRHIPEASNRVRALPGIDIRSDGGLVVGPESTHRTGRTYEWEADLTPDDLPIPHAPAWLYDLLTTRPRKVSADIDIIPQGQRSNYLASVAGSLRARGFGEGSIIPILRTTNDTLCSPPLPESELASIAKSIARYKPGEVGRYFKSRRQQDSPTNAPQLPRILITTTEHDVNSQALAALSTAGNLYQRGGMLVYVQSDPGKQPRILPVRDGQLRERLTECAVWLRRNTKTQANELAHPPDWATKAILQRGVYDLTYLDSISEIPVLWPDGSIHDKPGTVERGVLYRPDAEFPPLHSDHGRALADLLEIVCDFPFESRAHQATWLACLLTAVGRNAFAGPSPVFLYDANQPAAGKTLCAETVGYVVSGREWGKTTYTPDEPEMEKILTTLALEGSPVVFFDNIIAPFGSSPLDLALTSTVKRGRLLGQSQSVDAPFRPLWIATGNNVQLAGDMARRVLHVRIQAPTEAYESDRHNFRHYPLEPWIAANRPRLVSAALSLLRTFIMSRSAPDLPPLGKYEGFSRLIRGCVVWAGLPDPAETRLALKEYADSETEAMKQLLQAWTKSDVHGCGMTTLEAIERSQHDAILDHAIREVTGTPPGKFVPPRTLGNKLKSVRKRVLNGQMIDCRRVNAGMRWKCLSAECVSSASGVSALYPHAETDFMQKEIIGAVAGNNTLDALDTQEEDYPSW